MKLSAKFWAGVALSLIIVFAFVIQRNAENEQMEGVWRQKYQRVKMQISWHLVNLRHQHGTRQTDVAQNTILEIRQLWYDRDVLFHVLHRRRSLFSADSLIPLERLIDRRASPHMVSHEIRRVEQMNETD